MKNVLTILLIALSLPVHAWKGEDVDTGKIVNIHGAEGDIRDGDFVVFYTQDDSEKYFSGKIVSMFGFGRDIQLEVRDEDFGDRKIFNMQKVK